MRSVFDTACRNLHFRLLDGACLLDATAVDSSCSLGQPFTRVLTFSGVCTTALSHAPTSGAIAVSIVRALFALIRTANDLTCSPLLSFSHNLSAVENGRKPYDGDKR
jgi:hypothetical protein